MPRRGARRRPDRGGAGRHISGLNGAERVKFWLAEDTLAADAGLDQDLSGARYCLRAGSNRANKRFRNCVVRNQKRRGDAVAGTTPSLTLFALSFFTLSAVAVLVSHGAAQGLTATTIELAAQKNSNNKKKTGA